MFARWSFAKATRVFGVACVLMAVRSTPAMAGTTKAQGILATAPDDEAAIGRALKLLSRRPEKVVVIDPDDATPTGRKILARTDAFVTNGGRIVYINRHSEVLDGARRGSSLHLHMLAGIIWHEMAHIDGADETEAQRREETLWKRFLLDNRVDRITALRYLDAMNGRHR